MRRFESYLPSDLRVFARGILRMKSAIFGLPQILAGFTGLGLVAKVVVAVFVIATAAGGAFYAFSQKTYAPKTIHFDGRDFYLVSERDGDTGEVIAVYDETPGEALYVAGYSDSPPPQTNGDIFYYQVFYAENPAPELTDKNGAYSAVARFGREWGERGGEEGWVFFEVRESGDSIVRISAWDARYYNKGIRMGGKRCGASRKNAHVCIAYILRANPEKYPSPQEWTDTEGAAELERIYDLLANYPLSHNEELLSDMAAAK